ncbi:S24 family peptidase [Elizabethkingia anophelis]|uniref:S24 family peptidase n=1 Tax=Elizabethkingia anophelis TaxID=1117645 RepID=UPI0011BDAFE1|nr:S24 family peptidase [Elizabethkingia anophelis]MDC8024918.1 S24 family peptidase [Elizabethkingia anophelis]
MNKKKSLIQKSSILDLDKRLKEVMEYLLVKNHKLYKTQELVAKAISFSRPNLSAALKGNETYLTENIVDKFCIAFPELNKNWLMYGEGDMLKVQDGVTQIPYENYMWVEFEDLSAAAGTLGGNNVDELPETKKRLVPKEFDNGEYLVVRVDGDSMNNGTEISIPDGSEILIKRYYLNNGDKLPIRGNLFVIVAKDGRALKQITEHNTDLGFITCHSYNEAFEDYNVLMEDILEIYIYRKIVSNRPPIPDIKKK